ncbi:putative MFS monocarboxylate transporter [Acephala macrosclerotiorum]|nr:putative MFS monocarboxylate transporter [Acephala macrosclerotiorum]
MVESFTPLHQVLSIRESDPPPILSLNNEEENEAVIPRADGARAWLTLAECFMIEGLTWGFAFSFGVFQLYYTTHSPFAQQLHIAVIGTCSTGVMYLIAPISLYILEAWPSVRRRSSFMGLFISSSALAAASFSTHTWHLILTQGVLYAIGGSLLYSPTTFYIDDWFKDKKGLASGIMWAGSGTFGLIFPFPLKWLLNRYGFATTLRVCSIGLPVLCAPLIYFLKPRSPAPSRSQPISYDFFTTRTHICLQLCNFFESMGYLFPSIYLPSYANSLSLPENSGALLVALLNLFSTLGSFAFGALCDRFPVTTVITISTVGATTSVFLLWGFAIELHILIIFTACYGFFAGGFSVIWWGMMKEVKEKCSTAKTGPLMGCFAAGRGLGAILGGLLSGPLLRQGRLNGRMGSGTEYGVLIIFTGVSAAFGVLCWIPRLVERVRGLIS